MRRFRVWLGRSGVYAVYAKECQRNVLRLEQRSEVEEQLEVESADGPDTMRGEESIDMPHLIRIRILSLRIASFSPGSWTDRRSK